MDSYIYGGYCIGGSTETVDMRSVLISTAMLVSAWGPHLSFMSWLRLIGSRLLVFVQEPQVSTDRCSNL